MGITSQANEGDLFCYDKTSQQHIFNLGTKNLSVGTWRLRVRLDDGTVRFIDVSPR
jgi:hypothetical protein